MSRKSREYDAITENNRKIADLNDQIKLLRAVNEALQSMVDARKQLGRTVKEGA